MTAMATKIEFVAVESPSTELISITPGMLVEIERSGFKRQPSQGDIQYLNAWLDALDHARGII